MCHTVGMDSPRYSTHPTYRALLASVRASDYFDRLPRLVLADWLDENGYPERAATIRHQITHRGGLATWRGDQLTPADRGFKGTPGLDPSHLLFRRGFAVEVSCPLSRWTPRVWRWVLADHPITSVRLTDREPWCGPTTYSWYMAGRGTTHPASDLPARLFDLLPDPSWVEAGHAKHYLSEREALTALSAACLFLAQGSSRPAGRTMSSRGPAPRRRRASTPRG